MKGFNKYKVKANKFYTILIITIVEILLILWLSNWQFSPAIIPPFIQFLLIFENRDVWSRLSNEEKEDLTLTESDITNFVIGIEKKLSKGKSVEQILEKILE